MQVGILANGRNHRPGDRALARTHSHMETHTHARTHTHAHMETHIHTHTPCEQQLEDLRQVLLVHGEGQVVHQGGQDVEALVVVSLYAMCVCACVCVCVHMHA